MGVLESYSVLFLIVPVFKELPFYVHLFLCKDGGEGGEESKFMFKAYSDVFVYPS